MNYKLVELRLISAFDISDSNSSLVFIVWTHPSQVIPVTENIFTESFIIV